MKEPASFRGTPVEDSPRNRRLAALVAVLIVGFIGIAIIKPWEWSGGSPSLTPLPGSAAARASSAAIPTSTPAPTATAGQPTPLGGLGLDAFITAVPPPATAQWTGINWQRLAPSDPLALVRTVLRWRGGFIAVGWDSSGDSTTTPVWTSRGGTYWDPLPSAGTAAFGQGQRVLGIVAVPTGLVALTARALNYCASGPCFGPDYPPVITWTSVDGRTWVRHGVVDLGLPSGQGAALLTTVGPAGIFVAWTGAATHAASSPDGVHWAALPDGAIPTDLILTSLAGTATGYVLGGAVSSNTTSVVAATEWSADGRVWTRTPSPLALNSGVEVASTGEQSEVDSFVVGHDGLIALGRWFSTPGAEIWWQSADGRRWRVLDGYPPLGSTTCIGEGCGSQADGVLVGDGQRMVALRGGPDASSWTSSDGLQWRRLTITGDLPPVQARQAALLPGGVLLSDGITTWFGEATLK